MRTARRIDSVVHGGIFKFHEAISLGIVGGGSALRNWWRHLQVFLVNPLKCGTGFGVQGVPNSTHSRNISETDKIATRCLENL